MATGLSVLCIAAFMTIWISVAAMHGRSRCSTLSTCSLGSLFQDTLSGIWRSGSMCCGQIRLAFPFSGQRRFNVYAGAPGATPLIQGTLTKLFGTLCQSCGTASRILAVRNEMMNLLNYLELLCKYLPGCFEKCRVDVFMFDGAFCRRAKSVNE